MNKSAFLALCLCFSTALNAQSYQSVFGDSITSWTYIRSDMVPPVSDSIFVSDTLRVNGFKYFEITNDFDVVFLREDTSLGKLWIKKSVNSTERLIQDLQLNVGDYFKPWFLTQDSLKVDSVYFLEGRKHIRFTKNLTNRSGLPEEPLTFIEGSGPNNGILAGIYIDDYYAQRLLCHFKDNSQEYSNALHDRCDYLIIGVDDFFLSNNTIAFPNPTQGILYLKNPYLETFQVFNISGQQVQVGSIVNQEIHLNRDLNDGLYFLQISSANKSYNQRIVLNR